MYGLVVKNDLEFNSYRQFHNHTQTVLINQSLSNRKITTFKLCFKLPINFDSQSKTKNSCSKFFLHEHGLIIRRLVQE